MVIFWYLFCCIGVAIAQKEGYVHQKSKGFPWPLPRNFTSNPQSSCSIRSNIKFEFDLLLKSCDLMVEAEARARRYLFRKHFGSPAGLAVVKVGLTSVHFPVECLGGMLPPSEGMDESYEIKVQCPEAAEIKAKSVWGLLRGMETFTQLTYGDVDGYLWINSSTLYDEPAFPWRGLLLDTGHRFQPMNILLKNLEMMAMNKFNVFHWHIVDDPSFPWVSKRFPQLSQAGAYRPVGIHTYTPGDVQKVIQAARLLGIRVVPEFDTPGHSQSWGSGMPELLTKCYDKNTGKPNGLYGPFDPSSPSLMKNIFEIFQEIFETFGDKYVHLGGDEAFYGFDCWLSNPRLRSLMSLLNLTTGVQVQKYYTEEQIELLTAMDPHRKFVFWEEVFKENISLPTENTLLQVWSSNQSLLSQITERGLKAIYSSCWYLDYIQSTTDWKGFYLCDPLNFKPKYPGQLKLVIGGETCLWTKFVDSTNVLPRLWPRASAVAERLWSNPRHKETKQATIPHDVYLRLEEHRCRMIARGFPAEPVVGPGFCDIEYSIS